MRLSNHIALFFIAASLGACAILSEPKGTKVAFHEDVLVTEFGSSPALKKKGESIDVTDKPVLVEGQGYASAFLIPLHSSVGAADLNLVRTPTKVTETSDQKVYESLNKAYDSMNKLLTEFNEAQVLLADNRPGEAIRLADDLITRYPHVTHLKFFKASCLVVDGRRDEAQKLLEEGLRDVPDDKIGLELFRALQRGNGKREDRP